MNKTNVVVVDDDALFRDALCDFLRRDEVRVRQAADIETARSLLMESPSVVILDQRLPDGRGIDFVREMAGAGHAHRILMVTGHPAIADAVDALQCGIEDYIEKPVSLERLRLAVLRAAESMRLSRTASLARRQGREDRQRSQLIGRSLEPVRSLIRTAAASRCTVLITGETGTGKSLVAKSIHYTTDPSDALVKINCASLPAALVESELFGAAKGAYTGASRDRQGLFELADGGTLFLDEIGELEPQVQAKLLDALESGTIRRLGEVHERNIDVRIIAATNADLDAAVRSATFRRDLYFRLAVLMIRLPPLRKRLGDLPELVESLLADIAPHGKKRLRDDEYDRLRQYDWPGNVRELRNVLERATLLHPDNALRPSVFLGKPDHEAINSERRTDRAWGNLEWTLDELTSRYIERVIKDCDGNRTQAAKRLGVGLSTLRRRLNQGTPARRSS